ncbi:hypothetical protein Efla_005914 [Eimeria flavescens]
MFCDGHSWCLFVSLVPPGRYIKAAAAATALPLLAEATTAGMGGTTTAAATAAAATTGVAATTGAAVTGEVGEGAIAAGPPAGLAAAAITAPAAAPWTTGEAPAEAAAALEAHLDETGPITGGSLLSAELARSWQLGPSALVSEEPAFCGAETCTPKRRAPWAFGALAGELNRGWSSMARCSTQTAPSRASSAARGPWHATPPLPSHVSIPNLSWRWRDIHLVPVRFALYRHALVLRDDGTESETSHAETDHGGLLHRRASSARALRACGATSGGFVHSQLSSARWL